MWIVGSLNFATLLTSIISILFVIAIALVTLIGILLVINNWNFLMIKPRKFTGNSKSVVAVIIPTYGEPIEMVLNTLDSIVQQNWPKDKRIIIISDDGYNDELKLIINDFKFEEEKFGKIIYFRPYKKGHPKRKGDAKSGNLNSVLEFIQNNFSKVKYIETRDADDLVGSKDFLSYCIGLLTRDQRISFVQTIKRCETGIGDPFSNQESIFYQRMIPSRFASNAVFPCGSGLVWRLSALKKIGGFPEWNLVEDYQSGYEILRRGGIGAFLPILGTISQSAPEDIPNFYKQRGTWALDTIRLFYWRNPLFTKGLTMWQRFQFFESQFSYFISYAMMIFILNLILSLIFNIYPIVSSQVDYCTHFLIFSLIYEVYCLSKARGISFKENLRSRQIWLGLTPVFILATVKALFYGPNKKPSYKVTRKYHEINWYWKEVLIQKIIISILVLSIIINIFSDHRVIPLNVASILWSLFFIFGFAQIVKNSWYGIRVKNIIPQLTKPVNKFILTTNFNYQKN